MTKKNLRFDLPVVGVDRYSSCNGGGVAVAVVAAAAAAMDGKNRTLLRATRHTAGGVGFSAV